MKYALHVVRGRAGNSTIKLLDGVNSIGRHDDCVIRIRSAQVSRKHCELVEDGQTWLLRDLGSANGTFVNGKRVLGQQRLKAGDVITVGGVTLRLDSLGAAPPPSATPTPPPGSKPKASDTAELQALPEIDLAEDLQPLDDEFDVPLEEVVEDDDHIGLIPLDDDEPPAPPPAKPARPAAAKPAAKPAAKKASEPEPEAATAKPSPDEDAAVAQFLMDLKLDEED